MESFGVYFSIGNTWDTANLPVVKGFKQHETFLLCEIEHFLGLSRSVRGGLFQQDMFASREGLHGPLIMQEVRELLFIRHGTCNSHRDTHRVVHGID